jgi:hypothetical protein
MKWVHRPNTRALTRLVSRMSASRRNTIIAGAAGLAVVLLAGGGIAMALRQDGTQTVAARASAAASQQAGQHARRQGRLDVASGVDAMTVRTANLGNHMYEISTVSGIAPVAHLTEQSRLIQLRLTGGKATASSNISGAGTQVNVRLNSRVDWGMRMAAGLASTKLDLSQATLSTVDFAAGVGMVDLTLSAPTGTVPVHVNAGANQLTVHLRPGVAAQVTVLAGLGSMTLDGQTRSGGIPKGVYPLGKGYGQARDRYDIALAAGVSSLVVRRD